MPKEYEQVTLPKGMVKELKVRADWEGVSLERYLEALIKKCPHPFGC